MAEGSSESDFSRSQSLQTALSTIYDTLPSANSIRLFKLEPVDSGAWLEGSLTTVSLSDPMLKFKPYPIPGAISSTRAASSLIPMLPANTMFSELTKA